MESPSRNPLAVHDSTYATPATPLPATRIVAGGTSHAAVSPNFNGGGRPASGSPVTGSMDTEKGREAPAPGQNGGHAMGTFRLREPAARSASTAAAPAPSSERASKSAGASVAGGTTASWNGGQPAVEARCTGVHSASRGGVVTCSIRPSWDTPRTVHGTPESVTLLPGMKADDTPRCVASATRVRLVAPDSDSENARPAAGGRVAAASSDDATSRGRRQSAAVSPEATSCCSRRRDAALVVVDSRAVALGMGSASGDHTDFSPPDRVSTTASPKNGHSAGSVMTPTDTTGGCTYTGTVGAATAAVHVTVPCRTPRPAACDRVMMPGKPTRNCSPGPDAAKRSRVIAALPGSTSTTAAAAPVAPHDTFTASPTPGGDEKVSVNVPLGSASPSTMRRPLPRAAMPGSVDSPSRRDKATAAQEDGGSSTAATASTPRGDA
jgi:hypothetical protein